MAFRNPAIAGSYLVRPAIQSPNYVLGSAGWTINRDGSSEFNSGTFRGSLNSGNPSGQHVVFNPGNGDIVDVYDSSNRLVMYIDGSFGDIHTILQPSLDSVLVQGNGILFNNTASPPASYAGMTGTSSASGSHIVLDSGRGNASNNAILWLLDALSSSDGKSYVRAKQRADSTHNPITGSVVQTDTDNSSNNCFHVGVYSFTTNASGNATFNHGCSFTPAAGWLACELGGGTGFSQYAWFTNPFTSTQASAAFWSSSGSSVVSANLTAYGLFVG
jgi:hypothetical protein